MKNATLILIALMVLATISLTNAQLVPFNPDYYQNAIKNKGMSAKELKHYEEYKKEFLALGMPATDQSGFRQYIKSDNPFFLVDRFYHNRVSINAIKKLKDYKDKYDLPAYFNGVVKTNQNSDGRWRYGLMIKDLFTPVVIVGTVVKYGIDSVNTKGEFCAYFKVDEVLKGEYYFKKFPNMIKCYIHDNGSVQLDRPETPYHTIGRKYVLELYKFNIYNWYYKDSEYNHVPKDSNQPEVFYTDYDGTNSGEITTEFSHVAYIDENTKKPVIFGIKDLNPIRNEYKYFEEMNKDEVFHSARGGVYEK